ncbi:hypothetical protein BofuT4_uP147830.1 [Botrytis cinerea T4]|uniref:Uncharacterized protein n=1 Tax=Botryotinia fuckeliana (strain T4) TaxID=999810 RepID=G2YXK2_BOTF4|nr:hypothetical protein BofuT4_uP147830.1 [Botrytis cinerea T4]
MANWALGVLLFRRWSSRARCFIASRLAGEGVYVVIATKTNAEARVVIANALAKTSKWLCVVE